MGQLDSLFIVVSSQLATYIIRKGNT